MVGNYASLALFDRLYSLLCTNTPKGSINYDLMGSFLLSPSQGQLLLCLNGGSFNARPINFKIVKAHFCLPSRDANLTFL